eukprot:TRINITY_DN10734_c0_g1_i1.p1 TRINITY_DN10734_c0_g1~~TRINITY_DN10734_c0_g1_i1.p1  ORF type:complete len:455 (+),score=59.00 TRINITY_DN10734_c0_g1_i1:123-1367(+)
MQDGGSTLHLRDLKSDQLVTLRCDTASCLSRASTVSTAPGTPCASAKLLDGSSDEEVVQSFENAERKLDDVPCTAVEENTHEHRAQRTAPRQRFSLCTIVALTVFCGCACQAPYEVLHSSDRGCGHLVVFVEHIFSTIASASAWWHPRRAPMWIHVGLATFSIAYALLVNMALSTALSPTVVITMKNGNLVASMLLGSFVLGHRYALRQRAAVLLITCGLVLISVSGSQASTRHGDVPATDYAINWSAASGVVCVLGALLSRGATGILQEFACREYGAPVAELLFYRSVLGMPVMLFHWGSIADHALRWSAMSLNEAASAAGPKMWLLLLANVSFDYGNKVCISELIDRTSSLTATLVLTFQRFVSFIISATVLGLDVVGVDLWLGAIAVLIGTVSYTMAQDSGRVQNKKAKSA